MIFEVDNTTEKLLEDIQNSIEGAISSLKSGNEELLGEVEKLARTFAAVAKAADVRELADTAAKIEKLCKATVSEEKLAKNLEGVATTQQIKELKGEMAAILAKVEENKAKTDAAVLEVKGAVEAVAKIEAAVCRSNAETLKAVEKIGEKIEKTETAIDEIREHLATPWYKRKRERTEKE